MSPYSYFLITIIIQFSAIFGELDLIKQIIDKPGNKAETFLSPDDFKYDDLKEIDLKSLGFKVDEDSKRFEGDINLPPNFSIHQFVNVSNDLGRAAVRDRWRKWSNGEIPYLISNEYGSYSRRMIAKAFDEFHSKTCLRFVPREAAKHSDYIFIDAEDGCYSFVGRSGGRQPVSLDGGCMQLGTIIHELMHAAGHFHEQSRADRDDYVEVQWSNVRDGAIDQFEKYSLRTLTQLDLPYDYESIMHYGSRTFSRNGGSTLKALKEGGSRMGQRRGFSRLDLQKLNKLYDCPPIEVPDPGPEEPDNGGGGGSVVNNFGKRVVDWWRGLRGQQQTPAPCKNYKWHCFFWKWIGYCKTHKQYMQDNCPKKCDLCNAGDWSGGKESKTATITPISNNLCTDLHGHCNEWSKLDFCKEGHFTQYMRENCAKSCRFCSPENNTDSTKHRGNDEMLKIEKNNEISGENCANRLSRSACDQYAFWGMCSAKLEYMTQNCKLSCRLCNQ